MKTKEIKTYWRAIVKITLPFYLVINFNYNTYSQKVLINEDFTNYSIDNICSGGKWIGFNSPPTIKVVNSTSIKYSGYSSTGGKCIQYTNYKTSNGSHIHYPFTENIIDDGDIIYLSFLFRFNEKLGSQGDYFFSLNNTCGTLDLHFLRIYAKKGIEGFKTGISKGKIKTSNNSPEEIIWTKTEQNINETYLLLIKYITHKVNDEIYLWLNPDLSSMPKNEEALIQGTNLKDKLYIEDNFAGIDLTYKHAFSPNPIIDGIKIIKGNSQNNIALWEKFRNIAYNTPPIITKSLENISVISNSPNTTISLRDYFFDNEDNSSDLSYSVTSEELNNSKINIDPQSDKLVIDYTETGICKDCKITVAATDSGGSTTTQSFYLTITSPKIYFDLKGTEELPESCPEIKSFSIIKTGKTNQNIQLDYFFSGTALKGTDYTIINNTTGIVDKSGIINFRPNDTIVDISIKIVDDKIVEEEENIIIRISTRDATGDTKIITPQATKTIIDDDVIPVIQKNQHFLFSGSIDSKSIIGSVEAYSQMPETKLQNWTIINNTDADSDSNNAFGINPSTGEIFINDAGDFNYKSPQELKIKVSVSDGYNISNVEYIYIKILPKADSIETNRIYVSKDGENKQSGYSWRNALSSIQAALNQAKIYGSEEIWVSEGIYKPDQYNYTDHSDISKTNNFDIRKISFTISTNIKLYGGFSGNETDITQRKKSDYNNDGYISPWEFSNKSILSGDIGILNNKSDNCYHVLYCNSGLNNTTQINGFTIIAGNANGENPNDKSGGGIFCKSSSNPIISNNIITNNTADVMGGGLYCNNNNTNINSNNINSNSASHGGGISCNQYCNIQIIKNHIIDNIATEYGGGIYCSNKSIPQIVNNIISGNNSSKSGGGIDCYNNSNAYITNNTITNNKANLLGGGIFCHLTSTPIITNCILWGNKENNKPNQFNSSGSGFPKIFTSAVEGGFDDYKDFNTNKNINLSTDNNSNKGPRFYSNQNNDWRIKINSICKDNGYPDTVNLKLPNTDISGYKRLHGIIDIGAYEVPINKWPKAKTDIIYGDNNTKAGIDLSTIKLSSLGSFTYKNPQKIFKAGNNRNDTIIFKPGNKSLYSIEDSISINVEKAELTVKASNKSRKYGEENPRLIFNYSGFVYHDDSLTIDSKPSINTTATQSSPAGIYPIIISGGHDNNYTFNYINGALTINKKTPRISIWPKISSNITYGQSISETNLNITGCKSSVTGNFSFKNPTKILQAGENKELVIIFNPDDNINYCSVDKIYKINVFKALLALDIEDKSIFYGEQKPLFPILYSGFQNNEDESIFKNFPLAYIKEKWPLDIGSYDISININNINLNNYKLITNTGKLNILNNPPSLVDKIPNIITFENSENTCIDITNYFSDKEQSSNELNYSISSNIPNYLNCYINSNQQLIIDYNKTGSGNPEIITIKAKDKYNDYAEQSFIVEVNPGHVDFSVSGDEQFNEGNQGTIRKTFCINKIGNTNQTCSLIYEIKGNAEINSDYVIIGNGSIKSNGQLLFKPNETHKTISFDIKSDRKTEIDETIQLIIKNPKSEGNSTATISNFIATKTISNDDHSPEIEKNQSFHLNENSQLGTTSGKIKATDIDANSILGNWEITAGNTNNTFRINSNTGELIINNNNLLDKEKIDYFTLSVKVSDGINYSQPEDILIEIIDINDIVPIITPNQIFKTEEGVKIGTIISTIKVTDEDITPTNNYSWEIVKNLDTDNDGIPAIKIDKEDGSIIVNDADEIDYEKNKSITVTLKVNDGVNTSSEEFITIEIIDIQDNYEESSLYIYPNPAKEFTNISIKQEGNLFIYNDNGKLLINKKLAEGKNIIPLNNLCNGIYYFVIKIGTQTIEKTIIKD